MLLKNRPITYQNQGNFQRYFFHLDPRQGAGYGAGQSAGQKQAVQHGVGRTGSVSSVDTLVLILGRRPYKDQNGKNGPYFEEIEEQTANLIKLLK